MKQIHLKWAVVFLILITGLIYGFYKMYTMETKEELPSDEQLIVEEIIPADTLTLLFAGDIIAHDAQILSAKQEAGEDGYDFTPCFRYVKEYISSADLALTNLEVPFGGKPYRGYPAFSAPPQLANALKDAGFDILFTANNHALDRKKKGVEGTLSLLDSLDIKHTGLFHNAEEREKKYPLFIEANHIRLALLNYTYDTNGIELTPPNVVNYIDTAQIKQDLLKAQSQQPDYIIVCMHWGEEYEREERKLQRQLAQFLADNGADLIIGSHPHVIQPYSEIISQQGNTVPVIYSLGNFISNQQWRYSDGGIILEITIVKTEEKVEVQSVTYEPVWVHRSTIQPEKELFLYRLVPVTDYIQNPSRYQLDEEASERIMEFYNDTKTHLSNLDFSGFYNKDDN